MGSVKRLVIARRSLWESTIICGPESLKIIPAFRETLSEGYLETISPGKAYCHFLNMFNKKGILTEFKQAPTVTT